MSVYLPNGSRIYLKDPAGYAKIAEKIRAREPIVIAVTTGGVTTERTLWHPDDPVRLRIPPSYVPPWKPSLWQRLRAIWFGSK